MIFNSFNAVKHRIKWLTHISPHLYTNITLDLMRTNCLPRWCLWRHDTPLARVSVCVWVCMCARSRCLWMQWGSCVWVSVFCLRNVGVVPTRFTNNRPVQTVRAWQRMSHQPKQRTNAHSTVFGGISTVQGRVGAGRNYTESHLFRVKYNIFTVLTSVGSKFVLCPETANHPQGAEVALSDSTDIFVLFVFS